MQKKMFDKAMEIYLEVEHYEIVKAFCLYKLAQISNNGKKEPLTAYDLYYSALETNPKLFSIVMKEEHSSHNYVFAGRNNELEMNNCQLCGAAGKPYWCYPLPEAQGYNPIFNPIRLWLKCDNCNHLFSKYYPEKLFIYNESPRKTNPDFFQYYSNILSKISKYTTGLELFEIGIGACECLLVAMELGFETFGIDVIEKHVEQARGSYGLKAETHDFIEFETDRTWDVIIMGDVLEHVSNPVLAIKKAHSMLNEDGVLWISTPNFESAFALTAGHGDVMRRQQYHLNYFSRRSLFKLLDDYNFIPVEYDISSHYYGTMEVICVKKKSD